VREEDITVRCALARLLAIVTGMLIVLLGVVFALVQRSPAQGGAVVAPSDQGRVARGAEVYREQKCQACHAIAGVGSRRYPLDGVGSKLTEEDIRTWIVAPRDMDPQVSKRAYDLAQADLESLVAYLRSLRDP
jgi:mono/diheme cytochrome c family protein